MACKLSGRSISALDLAVLNSCTVRVSRFPLCVGLQSGAIMTVLAAVCTKIPEGRLAIIFLPMFTFTAGNVSIFMT